MGKIIFKGTGRKVVSATAAIAIAASMTVSPAAIQSAMADSKATDTDRYVTCASFRAAEPTPEILGLNNVATNSAWGKMGKLDWNAPYYYLFGTAEYNTSPNPLMVNSVANAEENEDGKYAPSMVTDDSRKGGPTASLDAYDTSDSTKKVWNQLPDVILGNSKGYNYNSTEFAVKAGAANDKASYKTYGAGDTEGTGDYGVVYDSTNINTMIDSMWNLSAAAKNAASGTGKELRYGDSDAIVANFESYVKGTQGYILKKLAQDGKSKKKVALVQSYDAATQTYKILATGVEEGTAAANRYLEAVQNVAINIADGKQLEQVTSGNNTVQVATATKAEVEACDLIMVGSQTGTETLSKTEDIVASMSANAQDKAYWASSANGSAGSCYGVVMNSVENAQNIGRILGCLYSEYVDQSDWIAYYYQNFYHLNTGKLSDAIDNAMDGVRNWNAKGSSQSATAWTKSDVSDYSESAVATKLAQGVSYIETGAVDVKLLQLTDNFKKSDTAAKMGEQAKAADEAEEKAKAEAAVVSMSDVTVKVASAKYNGKALKPTVTVTHGGKALAAGTYTVTYANNTKAGSKATATVAAVNGKGYKGSKTVTFTIAKGTQSLKVSTATKTVKAKSVKKKAQKTSKVTVKGAKAKYTYKKAGGSSKLKIDSKSGKITVKKGTKKGTYKIKVKVSAKSSANYNSATKTVTIKVKVK